TTGTDGDWLNVMQQFLRTGVSFAWTSCLGSGIAMDCLYGLPHRSTSKVNLGALKKGWVNIAVHGHSPLLIREIVKIGQSEEYQNKAREAGAEGIQFYGICCSGLSAMYRYGGVIPLSNAVGSELVLGTGALDLWVADVQDVFPTIMDVARCFRTVVVTTSDSARLPGAEHYGFDHEHSNIGDIKNLAKRIVERAIEAFADRRDVPVKIPQYEVEAEMGFSGHMLGAVFAATILGVPAAILSVALVVTVQCLAFNDGGTLQLGANILNMAVVATVVGGLIINRLGDVNRNVAIALGATVSIIVAVGVIAAELFVGGRPDGMLIRTLLVSHIPIALIEGALTVALVNVQNVPLWKNERKVEYALAAIIFIAFIISPFASTLPDALEAALGGMK
ncbi:MAG: energy-coupling factor ABC transporter permease, partial [Prevotella sp.]|nr:energy-coupling factor ABC transporter permease [Prevotella sp.]